MYVMNGFDLGKLSMQILYVLDVCVWFILFVYIYCLMNECIFVADLHLAIISDPLFVCNIAT